MAVQEQGKLQAKKINHEIPDEVRVLPNARSGRTTQILYRTDEITARIDLDLGKDPIGHLPVGPTIVYEQPIKEHHKQAREKLNAGSSTREYVAFFNKFHREEGLPEDWQNLQYGENQVGFSMNGQMDLLKGNDFESRSVWAKQTRQDLQGFVIEYLSPYIVFPWHHEKKQNPDGSENLVDSRYGGKKMVDTVSESERGGSVKKVIEAIDQAVVQKKVPDKSIFVQWSPMDETPTGLKQDNGNDVVYSDTHLIVSQVDGDRLNGFTVKTDLTQLECREMIRRLTGKVLSVGAPVESYIEAVALIDPAKGHIASIEDVINEAASVRENLSFGSKNAYENKSWDSVLDQIGKGDKLYEFTENMQVILKRFEEDVLRDNPTQEELREYIAATVLRVSQEAQIAKQLAKQKESPDINVTTYMRPSYGRTLMETAAIPGCAGGGSKTAVGGMFGAPRAVNSSPGISGSQEWFSCPKCQYQADGPIGNTCPGCKLTKDEFAESGGEVC